jgi:hypothetical protein
VEEEEKEKEEEQEQKQEKLQKLFLQSSHRMKCEPWGSCTVY